MASTSPPGPAAPQSAGQQAGPAGGPPQVELLTVPWKYRPWVPLAIAAAVAGLALLVLHIPGVLRYPTRSAAAVPPVASPRSAELEERNRSLREQIAQARGLIERNVCVRDGELVVPPRSPMPAGRDGTQPGSPASPGTPLAPGKQSSATPAPSPDSQGFVPVKPEEGAGILPRAPEQMPIPRDAVANFEGNLAELLDKGTVFVLAGGGTGTGSGFFISPQRVVTNRHVVDAGGDSPSFLVASKLLGGPKRARLVAKSGKGPPGSPDYAVLELEAPAQNAPTMPLTTTVGRLQRVTAAGFPGIVTQSDDKLQQLRKGVLSSIPETVMTQGTVTVVQNREAGHPIIGHEATISPGNSGGPLVDDCGRVVGVNTYGISDETGRFKVNYALGGTSLMAFLKSNGISFTSNEGVCAPPRPATAAAQPPPAPQPPGAAPAQPGSAPPTAPQPK